VSHVSSAPVISLHILPCVHYTRRRASPRSTVPQRNATQRIGCERICARQRLRTHLSTTMPARMALATLRNLSRSSPRRRTLVRDRVNVDVSQSLTCSGTMSLSVTSLSSSSSSYSRLQRSTQTSSYIQRLKTTPNFPRFSSWRYRLDAIFLTKFERC